MRKNYFFTICLFAIFSLTGFSQIYIAPPIPTDECSNAPMFSCNLDGYSGTNAGYTASPPPSNCMTIDNDQYLKFIADENSVAFTISVSNCTDAKGVQAAIYETNDCLAFNLVSTSCGTNANSGSNSFNILANCTIGNTYYLVIDGFEGDICDFSISVLSGILSDVDAVANNSSVCVGGETQIDASASVTTSSTHIQWTTSNGNIVSGANTLTPTIDKPGFYKLTLVDTISYCTSEKTVTIDNYLTLPMSNIKGKTTINCTDVSLNLDGSASSGAVSYLWSTTNGNITTDVTQDAVTIDDAGDYSLVVADLNGCTSESILNISIDTISPDANTAFVSQNKLTCTDTDLDIIGSSTQSVTYAWSGPVSYSSTSATTNVDIPGTYTLITTAANGCTGTSDIFVPIDTAGLIADAGVDTTINCTNPMIEIGTDNTTSGANISYQWTNVALENVGSLIKTQVSLPDTYKLIVTNSDNGCSKESSVVVTIDTIKPNLILSPTQILSCNQSTTSLTMNEGSGLSTVSYLWTDDGSFNETTSTINVTSAGTYHALLTNTENGCSTSGDVLVLNTTNTIVADAGPDVTLNCFQPIITIGESTSTSGVDIEYIWKNTSDITVGIESTLNVAIPDTYYFTVKDKNTGCTASDTVVISIDTLSSIATITNPEDTINCLRNSIQLMGEISDNSVTYNYNWFDTDFNFITNVQDLLITSGGDYHFEITRNDNGCKDTATVSIIDNTIIPTITIEQPDTITCKNSPVLLPINISSNSSSLQYHWTTSDGNIVLGTENSLSAYASAGGTYTISVTNLQNGCNATESISTLENKTPPIVDLIDDLELNCAIPETDLQTTNTSTGTNFTYEWKDNSGFVVSNSYSLIANSSNTYSLIVTDTTNGCTAQDIVNITENIVYPSTVIGYSEDTITCNRLSIPITGNASNFGPSIVYSWYDANWDLIISNQTELVVTSGGQYHFEAARGDNFCKDTFDFEIFSNNTPPDITMGNPEEITCTDPFITLPATVASQNNILTYNWSTTDGNITSAADLLNIFVGEGGTYTLEVNDLVNGCSATDNIVVVADTILPIADAGADFELNCEFMDIALGGPNTSQGSEYDYEWKDNSNTIISTQISRTINSPDTYELLVTDTSNGCTSTDRITITENKVNPVAQIDNTSTIVNCLQPQLTLDGSNSSPNGVDFDWKMDNNGVTISTDAIYYATGEGKYTLTVKDQNNKCENEISIDITEDFAVPTINITDIEQIDCASSVANIDLSTNPVSGNYIYNWTTINGTISGPNDQLDTEVSLASDDYTISITNQDNGCTVTKTITVVEDKDTPKITLDVSDELNCINETVNITTTPLDASLSLSFEWSGPGIVGASTTTQNIQANQQGDYFITTTNIDNGCTSQRMATVSANEERPKSAEIISEDPSCFEDRDGSIFIDGVTGGNLPLEYKINEFPFKNGNDFENLNAGDYNVTIRDNIGCIWDTTLTLVQPRPVTVKILGETSINLGETTKLFAQTNREQLTFDWFENDIELVDKGYEISVEPTLPTSYKVIAYDENGCADEDIMFLMVVNEKAVYFPTAITPNGDGQNDLFYCFSDKSVEKILTFNIFDRWGEMLFEQVNFQPNDPTYGWDGRLKGNFVSSGIYIYSAEVLFKDGKKEVFYGDFTIIK